MFRIASVALVLLALVTGCTPPSESTREKGAIDASGYALIHASSAGDNHHWSVDVKLQSAVPGTYALLFSRTEPPPGGWFAIGPTDPALRCAAAHGKGCTVADRGDIVGITSIGPGGTGVLRAAFDVGAGGWFQMMRVEAPTGVAVPFEIRVLSEALSSDETAQRFTIEQPKVASAVGHPAS